MSEIEELIASIYEAGALPELWTETLDHIASTIQAVGANFITSSPLKVALLSTPAIAQITREFAERGWNEHNTRVTRLLERTDYPGFLTDLDLHTPDEIRALPMYRDFLTPRGADAGAATFIAGAAGDGIVLAFEAFPDHDVARGATVLLDRLRPHLARASVLSSRIEQARVGSVIDALNDISMPLAVLDRNGRVISATDQFFTAAPDLLLDMPSRLRITDEVADARLVRALAMVVERGEGTSIALRNRKNGGAAVLQLLPARRNARDLFGNVAAYALLALPGNSLLPSVDIITALFDLTPAEAQVARAIAGGRSISALASELGLSRETIRTHLKKAFLKTSTRKQSELGALLSKFST